MREDHPDTHGRDPAANCEQMVGPSARSRNLLYGFELVALCDVPFNSA